MQEDYKRFGSNHYKDAAERLESRLDNLHESLEALMKENELLSEELAERTKQYDNLSLNADAIATEIVKVTESRRPLADALAILHNAVTKHWEARSPAATNTMTGMVLHGDPVDVALYNAQLDVQERLKEVEGLRWQIQTPTQEKN